MKTLCVQVALVALLAGACLSSALSIENEQPVKVTHRNSGPRYDIDDSLERTRALVKEALASSPSPPPAAAPSVERPAPEAGQDENAPAVGHIALRRIFLIPIMRPQGDEHPLDQAAGSQSGREQEDSGEQSPRVPMMMAKPLWPFMMPARPTPGQAGHPDGDQPEGHDERPHIMRHLFGADQASRSPDMERAAAERDESQQVGPQQPHAFDPIQMMMDMMHQAISSQLGRDFAKNLNSDSSSNNNNNKEAENTPAAESSNERPTMPQVLSMKPGSQNETREDIVEIEGRKYVRKTLINRHVGDNLVFMTRRLIFIPLNETEAGEPTEKATTTSTTTTTTELPPSSSQTPPQEAANEASERPSPPVVLNRAGSEDAKPSEAPQTPSTSAPSTTTSTEQPSSVKPAEEQTTPASSTSKPEESTTVSSSTEAAQRDASPKAAERLVEASSESPKPAEKETPKSSP